MKSPAHRDVRIDALRDAGDVRRDDPIAVEEPLEIRVMRDGLPEADENGGTGRSLSVTMRTPGHDAELAAGFLYGEGVLREPRDLIDTGHCGPTGNIFNTGSLTTSSPAMRRPPVFAVTASIDALPQTPQLEVA